MSKTRPTVKKAAFLAAFAECGIISEACRIAGVHRSNVREWRKKPDFLALYNEAYSHAVAALEKEARRRAVLGVDEPVFHKGEQCGTVRKFSDTLLIFLLKGAKPKKYREHHTATNINFDVDPASFAKMTDEELDQFISRARSCVGRT